MVSEQSVGPRHSQLRMGLSEVQSLHFIGFALSIGTIAIVDFRLLGLGMRRQTPAELAADLDPWTRSGIAIMLITGPLMFSTDAVAYHYNPSFQFKMVCLTAGLALPLHAAPAGGAAGALRLRPSWQGLRPFCSGPRSWPVDE